MEIIEKYKQQLKEKLKLDSNNSLSTFQQNFMESKSVHFDEYLSAEKQIVEQAKLKGGRPSALTGVDKEKFLSDLVVKMWDIYKIKPDSKSSNTSYTISMIEIKKNIIDKSDTYKIKLLCKLLN